MYRLTVIPEIGNSAQSKPSYATVESATADGRRLASVIFGNIEQLPHLNEESMEAYVAGRIAAMMSGERGPSQEPKILEMFSLSELEGLLTFQQPSVRVMVTDAFNNKKSDQFFKKADFQQRSTR
jgi:hypothetical protein